ncbi:MAG: tRNA lysidine(34) synthetase TilS [Rhodobacteraceae bacterium]|nr:tRNA lysidine(34) synthetase TilS [Paracoccaceae bacterium]
MIQSDANIRSLVREKIGPIQGARLGVAVSGGGDSVALLHILSRCFDADDVQLFAATVDHGLRPESADEAQKVAELADSLGIAHSILKWTGWDGTGNLQNQAREARYQLLGKWAKANHISTILLGHTKDDQAETVLMRLGRSAGVDGLAGIPPRRVYEGVTITRPVLSLSRSELRDYLIRHGVNWIDDPSNDDSRFDRIKARKALDLLEPIGITAESLDDVAQNMVSARAALDWYCFLAARESARVDGGNIVLDQRKFRLMPDETARRLLVRTISWISGSDYPPRRAAVIKALDALRESRAITLGGCHVLPFRQAIWVCREFNAVHNTSCDSGQVWDQRWRLSGEGIENTELRALGHDGLKQYPGWRDTARPAAALIASPSVWKGGDLLAAPFAGLNQICEFELIGGSEGFFSSILTH